jgi:hypothetical protein
MGTKFIQECYWQERFFRNVLGKELYCQVHIFEELYFQERFAGNVLVGTFLKERCVRVPCAPIITKFDMTHGCTQN